MPSAFKRPARTWASTAGTSAKAPATRPPSRSFRGRSEPGLCRRRGCAPVPHRRPIPVAPRPSGGCCPCRRKGRWFGFPALRPGQFLIPRRHVQNHRGRPAHMGAQSRLTGGQGLQQQSLVDRSPDAKWSGRFAIDRNQRRAAATAATRQHTDQREPARRRSHRRCRAGRRRRQRAQQARQGLGVGRHGVGHGGQHGLGCGRGQAQPPKNHAGAGCGPQRQSPQTGAPWAMRAVRAVRIGHHAGIMIQALVPLPGDPLQ
ncbi:hypothetical protein Veis_3520 [Verminephrobacter eiseniae EF01-2]|uniref:Uncharacterized protein n=1 Tax=Verminephrobacter eiseniae (strain EF01-2) TaxID=391735 RepID=A1WNN2_VEREI|nr:hypothetical protein Veis_3520 [Verminephrobacter eiseniae EF01-2]